MSKIYRQKQRTTIQPDSSIRPTASVSVCNQSDPSTAQKQPSPIGEAPSKPTKRVGQPVSSKFMTTHQLFPPISQWASSLDKVWLRGQDLNLRPSGYEPDELPGCSTPRRDVCVSTKLRVNAKIFYLMNGFSSLPFSFFAPSADDNAWRRPTLPTLER